MEEDTRSNKDYPLEMMLEEATKYVAEQEVLHPMGLKGAFIIYDYTEDRWELPFESNDPKDNAYTYMCSGLTVDQMLMSMERLRFKLHKEQMRAEARAVFDKLS